MNRKQCKQLLCFGRISNLSQLIFSKMHSNVCQFIDLLTWFEYKDNFITQLNSNFNNKTNELIYYVLATIAVLLRTQYSVKIYVYNCFRKMLIIATIKNLLENSFVNQLINDYLLHN